MPKLTKNTEVFINITNVSSTSTTQLNNYSQQLKNLTELSVPEYSTRIGDVKSLLGSIYSISGALFTQVLRISLQAANTNNASDIAQIVLLLSEQNYDQEEVVSYLKRDKQIDAIFALALLWKYLNNNSVQTQKTQPKIDCVVKIIRLLLISYPVDLMISGGIYLVKWREYLQKEALSMKQKNNIQTLVGRTIQKYDKIEKQGNGFVDIVIPL